MAHFSEKKHFCVILRFLFFLCRRLFKRQEDAETGVAGKAFFKFDASPPVLHQAPAHGEAEALTLPHFSRCKKRLKNITAHGFRNDFTGIAHADFDNLS